MPSPLYLLDTNVILHLVRGNDLGKHLVSNFGLMNAVSRPLVSVVTHGELYVLADRNRWGSSKLAALKTTLDNLVTIDLNDESIIKAYVDVQRFSRLAPGGSRELQANDAWIVACAKAAAATLITTDQDFQHLKLPAWPVHFVNPDSYLHKDTP